ncbi:hypothetical protein CDD82_4661 [Ophiocordyceps australis]|uniref:Chromo domain-containing protein n=1 Tax=Ophiocordyceps australis TaxID=1399860 RepID=A0A2C5Y749_9HYPO|nr:hypothetical protein CDD82_4661 [Ophiocordyceps australis]
MPPPVSISFGREGQVSSDHVEKLDSSLKLRHGTLPEGVSLSPIKSDTADTSEPDLKIFEQPGQPDRPATVTTVKQARNRSRQVKHTAATRRSARARSASAKPPASPKLERGGKTRQKQQGARAKREAAPTRSSPPARGSREWEIETIVESCIEADTFTHFYFVKWKGFSSKFNTWEPKINLKNCPAVLKAYEKQSKKT